MRQEQSGIFRCIRSIRVPPFELGCLNALDPRRHIEPQQNGLVTRTHPWYIGRPSLSLNREGP
jgi:hypothetical protein